MGVFSNVMARGLKTPTVCGGADAMIVPRSMRRPIPCATPNAFVPNRTLCEIGHSSKNAAAKKYVMLLASLNAPCPI
jgi:hypothetical protein